MKRVVQTLAIHVFCILFFALFYYYFSLHFDNNNKQDKQDKQDEQDETDEQKQIPAEDYI